MGTHDRTREFFDLYTKDFSAADFQLLLTRDTKDAYRFFARHIDEAAFKDLPPLKRALVRTRLFFLAFTLKLSPARRVLFGIALVVALLGMFQLWEGFGLYRVPVFPFFLNIGLPGLAFADGALWLLCGFLLVNLLVLLEVADRLSLKNDLEIARDIQLAMLPQETYEAAGVEAAGRTRPANTVGGDCYDILPLDDGRVLVMLGDVAGKGSPAALLMALLLAMLRTLATDDLPPDQLVTRLNRLVYEQAPGSRFITMFLSVLDPRTGELTYVNAGQTPPLLRRQSGDIQRLLGGGMALGMFDGATYEAERISLDAGDLLVMYSDGVTEAENASGVPFEEPGLRSVLAGHPTAGIEDVGRFVFHAVEQYAGDTKLADDLTVLALRRLPPPAPNP